MDLSPDLLDLLSLNELCLGFNPGPNVNASQGAR
jgi:hypothetical protein